MHPGFGASEKGSKTGLLKNADCQHFVGKVGLLEGSGNHAIENHHLAIENHFSMLIEIQNIIAVFALALPPVPLPLPTHPCPLPFSLCFNRPAIDVAEYSKTLVHSQLVAVL